MWTRELQQMNQRTRKLMTIHKDLHPIDDIDRLNVPRKEAGKGLTSIEDSIDASIRRLKDYIKETKKNLLQRQETTRKTQRSTEQ